MEWQAPASKVDTDPLLLRLREGRPYTPHGAGIALVWRPSAIHSRWASVACAVSCCLRSKCYLRSLPRGAESDQRQNFTRCRIPEGALTASYRHLPAQVEPGWHRKACTDGTRFGRAEPTRRLQTRQRPQRGGIRTFTTKTRSTRPTRRSPSLKQGRRMHGDSVHEVVETVGPPRSGKPSKQVGMRVTRARTRMHTSPLVGHSVWHRKGAPATCATRTRRSWHNYGEPFTQ